MPYREIIYRMRQCMHHTAHRQISFDGNGGDPVVLAHLCMQVYC
jgi:hypothetical protein